MTHAQNQMSRCYITDVEDACNRVARYEARLNWTAGLMLLCEEHAIRERADGDVIWIKNISDASSVRSIRSVRG
jgi:hypothetical protein